MANLNCNCLVPGAIEDFSYLENFRRIEIASTGVVIRARIGFGNKSQSGTVERLSSSERLNLLEADDAASNSYGQGYADASWIIGGGLRSPSRW
jgi:hypothetical protein